MEWLVLMTPQRGLEALLMIVLVGAMLPAVVQAKGERQAGAPWPFWVVEVYTTDDGYAISSVSNCIPYATQAAAEAEAQQVRELLAEFAPSTQVVVVQAPDALHAVFAVGNFPPPLADLITSGGVCSST